MKYKFIPYVFFVFSVFVFSSCKDKLFDFNLQQIEADGEWGLPVCHGKITVDHRFDKLDSTSNLHFGSDVTLTYVFENTAKNIVSLHNLFRINDQVIDTSGTVDITSLPNLDVTQIIQFNINSQDFRLRNAIVKSGQLMLNFGISNSSLIYNAELVSGNILNTQGDSLRFVFNNSTTTHIFNLSNYTLQPDEEGHILFSAHVTIPSTDLAQFQYSCHVELSSFSLYSVVGQVRSVSQSYGTHSGFNLPLNDLHIDNVTFHDAKTKVFAQNDICNINCNINDFRLFGHNGAYTSLLNNPPFFLSIPVSPNQYTYINELNIPPIAYNSNIDSIGIQCDFTVNPLGFDAGDISVNENSTLNLLFKTELSTNMSIDNAVYADTLDNSLYQQLSFTDMQSIETLTLRLVFTNALPFDLIPSISFMNSRSGQTYPINLCNMNIHGGYNDNPYPHQPIYLDLSNQVAQQIVNSDKIILHFTLNTQGHNVVIKDSQYISLAIGAKVKYSNINM